MSVGILASFQGPLKSQFSVLVGGSGEAGRDHTVRSLFFPDDGHAHLEFFLRAVSGVPSSSSVVAGRRRAARSLGRLARPRRRRPIHVVGRRLVVSP